MKGKVSPMPNGALEGVKIVDFTQMMAGPWATQMLADLGAEVIKIERPGVGEWERGLASMGELLAGDSPFFHAMNRNKKSLTLDLKHPKSKEIIYKLVAEADVVAENFRPGVLDRLGYGYDKLSSLNPGLVYLSSSGYGTSGPYLTRPGQDLLIQGLTGMITHTGRLDSPMPAGSAIMDEGTAFMNVITVLAALYYKQKTGQGQKIEVNMLDTAISMQCQEAVAFLNLHQKFERSRSGIGQPWLPAPYGVYPTSDGFITIAMNDLNVLATIFELPLLKELVATAFENRDRIKYAIEAVTPTRTTTEWLDRMAEYDIWCGPVKEFDEVFTDPQVLHNGTVIEMDHPKAGQLKLIGFPAKFSQTPPIYKHAAPLVGEHNAEILGSLGYTEAEIEEFSRAGISGVAQK